MIPHLRDLPEKEVREHIKHFGGHNDFPPNWHELTEEEFARSPFFSYPPKVIEYRQMRKYHDGRLHDGPAIMTNLHFMNDNTGYAIVADYWDKKVHFYKFGCEHQWGDATAELKRRNRYLHTTEHASFCEKCGFLRIVDSSD